jgi:hypothetical protein
MRGAGESGGWPPHSKGRAFVLADERFLISCLAHQTCFVGFIMLHLADELLT